jgi:hypothetical protein
LQYMLDTASVKAESGKVNNIIIKEVRE